jgi:hypothetical protein
MVLYQITGGKMINKSIITKIRDFESGKMSFEEHFEDVVDFFQELIDTGIVWKLQGSYQRTAIDLYEGGWVSIQEE